MGGFPDPFSSAASSLAPTWASSMASTSQHLFMFLFFMELAVLGVQSVIFKDSVVEYIKNFAGKVVIGSFVIALLANANLVFPFLVSFIAGIGNHTATGAAYPTQAACAAHLRWSCVPPQPSDSGSVEAKLIGWAMLYFAAGDLSRITDSVVATAIGLLFGTPFPPDPGNGPAGLGMDYLMGHGQFQLVCFALGMTCIASAALVFLTYILLTFETQIVLAIGIFTLAGYGFRYTEQFAKAFPTYCFTIGTKFFAFYFVVAVMNSIINATNFGAMLAGLIGGAVIPFGAGAVILLLSTSTAPVVAVVSAILIASVPQIAASMTKGGSALSAMGGLKNVTQYKMSQ